MCGINGILAFGKAQDFTAQVQTMNLSMQHRGPDGEGEWCDNDIALGHRRLAIIDLSSAGNQPMFSHDRQLVLVFNGEIYNYLELKNELRDYPFHTQTDSEVILAAYQRWGAEAIQRFRGMFAFALWDCRKKELILARDRMGKKPLYYFFDKDRLVFSSEIRSLLASGCVPKKLDEEALADYFRYQTVHSPHTMVKGVMVLKAGHYQVYGISAKDKDVITVQTTCYWNISDHSHTQSPLGKSETEVYKEVNDLLYRSVERRLISDVPFGAFLSGGIDSSVLVGIMSRIMTHPVNTFSVTFEEKQFSEASYSEEVAKRFHTSHHPIHLRANDLLAFLPEALKSMDHPSGDGLNTWVISKVTRNEGISMALSGIGADELFAGYDLFKRLSLLNQYKIAGKIPGGVKKVIAASMGLAKPSMPIVKAQKLLQLKDWNLDQTYSIMRETLADEMVVELLKRRKLPGNKVADLVAEIIAQEEINSPFLSQVTRAEFLTYLQSVLLRDTDQMSMAHALEVRAPFLDYELVEYVLQVPDRMKFPHTPKQLLTRSVGDLLPDRVVHRKKMGFVFPWEVWMKKELKAFCEVSLQKFKNHPVISFEAVWSLWLRFQHGDPLIGWSRVWPLVVLGNWMMENGIE